MTHGTTEQIQAYRRRTRAKRHAAEHARRKQNRISDHRFLAIDGEGWNRGGVHNYHMIVTSNPNLYIQSLEPLTSEECLRFIGTLPVRRGEYVVSFFFDYDVTMILRDIAQADPDTIKLLPDNDEYVWIYNDIGIKYVPHKHFTVKIGERKPVTIHDTQGYFQSSFVKALQRFEIATPEIIANIGSMKEQRAIFTAEQIDDIRRYSLNECTLLVELITRVKELAARAKLNPSPYEGPGGLASRAMTRGYGKKAHSETAAKIDERMQDAIAALMYGGRFETLACGKINAHVKEYDRHSAYPAIMSGLPCFRHGYWKRSRKIDAQWAFAYIEYDNRIEPSPGMCYPLPNRSTAGSLHYPKSGAGYYWQHEYLNDPNLKLTIGERWVWVPDNCDCKPFAWARDLFNEREQMELEHKGSGIVLKLTLNTLYGKTAQTKPKPGPWNNLIYASIITSKLRTDMFNLYQQCDPLSVFMFATDAIFTSSELPVSHGLGGLELADEYDDLCIVQPGLYFDSSVAHYKTRGIPKKYVEQYGDDIKLYAQLGMDYPLRITQFHGLRLSLANNKPEMIGQWTNSLRVLRTRQHSKRIGETIINDTIYTTPKPNTNVGGISKPRNDFADMVAHYSDLLGDDESDYE